MQTPIQRFRNITKAIDTNYYNDLAIVEIADDSNLEIIKLKITPHEGVHQNIEYIVTFKFQGINEWPHIFIDSEIYDRIKTPQYLQNKGKVADHKGICIKNLGYAYCFTKNFKNLCGNKWENYIYYVITVFNNLQDFERGNGLKSNYKEILEIK